MPFVRLLLAAVLAAAMLLPLRSDAANQVVVTQYGTVLASLPWAVALHDGFLRKEPLDVDGVIGSNGGGTTIRNMLASPIPFAEVATSAAVAAARHGIKLHIVYAAVNNTGDMNWMVLKDSPIHRLSELAGQKVGYDSPQSWTEVAIRTVLARTHMTGKVQLIATGGNGAGITAMEAGGVAAVPFPTAAIPAKARTLFKVIRYIPHVIWQVGVTTDAYAAAHPEVVRALVAARAEAVDAIYAHPAQAAEIYAKVWNVSFAVARRTVDSAVREDYWSRGNFNRDGLDTMAQGLQLVDGGKPVDLDALIDRRFLPPHPRS